MFKKGDSEQLYLEINESRARTQVPVASPVSWWIQLGFRTKRSAPRSGHGPVVARKLSRVISPVRLVFKEDNK
jgi:hypothetical protein